MQCISVGGATQAVMWITVTSQSGTFQNVVLAGFNINSFFQYKLTDCCYSAMNFDFSVHHPLTSQICAIFHTVISESFNCAISERIEVGLKSIAVHSCSITLNWAIEYLSISGAV